MLNIISYYFTNTNMISIISCSFLLSIFIYNLYSETKKYFVKKKEEKLDKQLPQMYGCNHQKCFNTYFYEDKIYCHSCWNQINKNILNSI